jgi:hypothetical protein
VCLVLSRVVGNPDSLFSELSIFLFDAWFQTVFFENNKLRLIADSSHQ